MFFSMSTSSKLKNIYSLGFVVGLPAVVYQINCIGRITWTQQAHAQSQKLKANRASETEEQSKERLRIKRENKKIVNHEKQRLATLKI